MNHFQKTACLLISLLFFILFSVPAAPAENDHTCGSSLVWDLDRDGLLTVSGTGEMDSYTDRRPPWNPDDLRRVIIEPGVTGIGAYAFKGCDSLISIELPDTLTSIGDYAFSGCSWLSSVTLGSGLQSIGSHAFDRCLRAERINFFQGLEEIGDGAFCDMYSLRHVILPEGLKSIGDEAFGGCSNLESILIPGSVEEIGKSVFAGTDTINLIVYITEGSAAEQYCRENGLTAVLPGQDPPGPEAVLPAAFAEHYPGYKGLYQLKADTEKENEAVFLAQTPEGALVLLCGTRREDTWTIIESAALPAESKMILYDGLQLLELGYARCAVRRYHDDLWGIDYVGWKDMYIGPCWVGSQGPQCRYFGNHTWGDLTTISWISLEETYDGLLKAIDVSAYATPNRENAADTTPIYRVPDEGSERIAELLNGIPLFVTEKNDTWTHVSFGRGDEHHWKLDGWIRTADLAFGAGADGPRCTETDLLLYADRCDTLTLITPNGNEELPGSDYDLETWYIFGETETAGQEYWLVYDCYSERLGFILKEKLHELNG